MLGHARPAGTTAAPAGPPAAAPAAGAGQDHVLGGAGQQHGPPASHYLQTCTRSIPRASWKQAA